MGMIGLCAFRTSLDVVLVSCQESWLAPKMLSVPCGRHRPFAQWLYTPVSELRPLSVAAGAGIRTGSMKALLLPQLKGSVRPQRGGRHLLWLRQRRNMDLPLIYSWRCALCLDWIQAMVLSWSPKACGTGLPCSKLSFAIIFFFNTHFSLLNCQVDGKPWCLRCCAVSDTRKHSGQWCLL